MIVTVTQILNPSNKIGYRTQTRDFNIIDFSKDQYGQLYNYIHWAKSRADLRSRKIELAAIGRLNFHSKFENFTKILTVV